MSLKKYILRRGTTATIRTKQADYTSADGWALSLAINGYASSQEFPMTEEGDEWVVSLPAMTTAGLTKGKHEGLFVARKADEVLVLDSFVLDVVGGVGENIEPSVIESQISAVDDAISSILAGKGVQSYTINTIAGSRSLQHMSLKELRELRRWLKAELAKSCGGGKYRIIKTCFNR